MNTENAAASTDSEHEEPTIGNPRNIASLLEVMKRLRDPQSGCPWDIEQDFESIAPYTVEEAYEVQDAIARNNMADLRGAGRPALSSGVPQPDGKGTRQLHL